MERKSAYGYVLLLFLVYVMLGVFRKIKIMQHDSETHQKRASENRAKFRTINQWTLLKNLNSPGS